MIKFIFWGFITTCGFNYTNAQELFVPRDVRQAYKNETRSPDGKPGKNYWQNHGRYNISVTAMPPDRNIKGEEQIAYTNNSPDTLRNLVFKLILNIHKPGAGRMSDADSNYLTSGIHIDAFSVNGQSQKWTEPKSHVTWQSVRLQRPLMPHDSVQLTFNWHYEISLQSGREGMLDSTTFFLAYFYPRVAVYDDYLGWDRMNFTDAQEFYNDFNDYTLTVNAPKNYIVWATGTLQNPAEVLQSTYAQRLKASMTTDSIIHIATKEDIVSKNITAQNAMNSWRWTAENICDVTVAISDHYVWDASSVIVDDDTHRRASVQSAFNDKAEDFHHMVSFGRHALDWFSHNWPGVPYPFPKTTIVQGFADMEYPMMVNDGSNKDTVISKFIAEHEIAHTWFPFYMGINETRYGFMDEGWATTLELLIGRDDLGIERADNFYRQFRVQGWINDKNAEEQIPIIIPGNILRGPGLGNNEYGKASLGYLAVKDLLGDELFKKALHGYMDRWHGKHPDPWDFFNCINDGSKQDLNWFWNNWFFSPYYIDLAVDGVRKIKNGYEISIKNIGGYAAPVDVVVKYDDGTSETLHQTPNIWKADQRQSTIRISTKKKIRLVQLKGGIFIDADETNNTWNVK